MTLAPFSVGELIDKIVILRMTTRLIVNERKLVNLRHEVDALEARATDAALIGGALESLADKRATVNASNGRRGRYPDLRTKKTLRACASSRWCGRSTSTNDERAALKREINVPFDSGLVEEKSYA